MLFHEAPHRFRKNLRETASSVKRQSSSCLEFVASLLPWRQYNVIVQKGSDSEMVLK